MLTTLPGQSVVLSISSKCWCCFGSLHHDGWYSDRGDSPLHLYIFIACRQQDENQRFCLKSTKWFLWELFNLHLSTQSCHCPLLLLSSVIVECKHNLVAATWPDSHESAILSMSVIGFLDLNISFWFPRGHCSNCPVSIISYEYNYWWHWFADSGGMNLRLDDIDCLHSISPCIYPGS